MAKNSSAPVDTVEKPTAEICFGKFYDKRDENCANKCGLSDHCKVALAKVEALLRPIKKELFPELYGDEPETDDAVEPELTLAKPDEEEPQPEDIAESYDKAKTLEQQVSVDDDDDEEQVEVTPVTVVDDDDDEDLGKPKEESVDEIVPVAVVEEDDDEEDLLGAKEVPTKEELAAVVDGTPDEDEDDNVIELPVLPEAGDPEELAQEEEKSVDSDPIWDDIDDDEDDEDE